MNTDFIHKTPKFSFSYLVRDIGYYCNWHRINELVSIQLCELRVHSSFCFNSSVIPKKAIAEESQIWLPILQEVNFQRNKNPSLPFLAHLRSEMTL